MIRERSEKVGRKWRLGILAAIMGLGAVFATMMFVQPAHSVTWAVLLVLYVPVVLIVAALLKWAVITARGLR